jgi:hypothetical protein
VPQEVLAFMLEETAEAVPEPLLDEEAV